MAARSRIAIVLAALAGTGAPLAAALVVRDAPDAVATSWRLIAAQAFFAGLALLLALRLGGSLPERLPPPDGGAPL